MMISKILKLTMILTICVSIWQLWTNFEFYIANDNFAANQSSQELIKILEKSGNRVDNAVLYRGYLLFASLILTIFVTNSLYNKARGKIEHFDLSSKYSKKRAIGSFFIPFVNLVLPRICINELEHIMRPDNLNLHDSDSFKKRNRSGDIWWVLWIVVALFNIRFSSFMESALESTEELNSLLSILNKYVIGQSFASILLVASMLNGVKYFDYLFRLSENNGEFSESETNPL